MPLVGLETARCSVSQGAGSERSNSLFLLVPNCCTYHVPVAVVVAHPQPLLDEDGAFLLHDTAPYDAKKKKVRRPFHRDDDATNSSHVSLRSDQGRG